MSRPRASRRLTRPQSRWRLRGLEAEHASVMAQIDGDLLHDEDLAAVGADCDALGGRAVHQGRKLYVLPAGLDIAAAVAEVCRRVAEESGVEHELLAAGE